MRKFWQRSPAFGVGLGVGVAGAVMLAVRYGFKRSLPEPLPEGLSPEAFSTRVCQTSQGELVYHVSGSGDPMVFLHHPCIGNSSYEWSGVYPAFAGNHEVIAIDLQGFGESERPRAALSPENHARAIADFLHVVCPARPAVIVASGLSAGLAMLLAAQHPETVSRLVLLSPIDPGGRRPKAPGVFRMPGPRSLRKVVYRNHYARKPFLRGWLVREGLSSAERVTDELVHVFSTCALQYGAEYAVFKVASRRWCLDFQEIVPRIIHPTTMIFPELLPESARAGTERARFGGAGMRQIDFPGAGFFAALDAPEACIDLLRAETEYGLRPLGASTPV